MDGLLLRTYKGEKMIEGAKIAIKHRLCIPGWQLRINYQSIVESAFAEPENKKRTYGWYRVLVVAFLDKEPVGSLLIENDRCVMLFVKRKHRRKGIGTAMVKKALRQIDFKKNEVWGWKGNKCSKGFFTSVKS